MNTPAWSEEASDALVVEGQRLPASDGEDSTVLLDRIMVDADPRIHQGWGDLLDRSLGARVQRSGSPGRREVLQLRGAGSHQIGVYLDGVRLSGERGGTGPLQYRHTVHRIHRCTSRSAGAAYGSGAQGGIMRLNPARSTSHSVGLGRRCLRLPTRQCLRWFGRPRPVHECGSAT